MKRLIICFLAGILWSAITFSQTDTAGILKSRITFPPKKFNNHFYNLQQTSPPLPFISLLKKSEHRVSYYNSSYNYVPYSAYQQHTPLWKDIMTLAGQTVLSTYASEHNIFYVSPPQW